MDNIVFTWLTRNHDCLDGAEFSTPGVILFDTISMSSTNLVEFKNVIEDCMEKEDYECSDWENLYINSHFGFCGLCEEYKTEERVVSFNNTYSIGRSVIRVCTSCLKDTLDDFETIIDNILFIGESIFVKRISKFDKQSTIPTDTELEDVVFMLSRSSDIKNQQLAFTVEQFDKVISGLREHEVKKDALAKEDCNLCSNGIKDTDYYIFYQDIFDGEKLLCHEQCAMDVISELEIFSDEYPELIAASIL